MRKQKNSQDETAKGLLDWVRKGRNPATYLAGEGFASPATALRNIKDYAKKHYSPEIVEEICRITLRGTKTAPAEPKPSENPPEEVKAPETVVVAGKEYEKYEGVKEYPPLPNAADKDIYGKHPVTAYIEKKPSPTCCQPARPSGVMVPDELPGELTEHMPANEYRDAVKFQGKVQECAHSMKIADEIHAWPEMLAVCGVMGSYGRFEQNIELKGEKYMTFVMHMKLTGEDIRITFSADQWKTMLKEIPMALRQLGLSK